MKKNTYNSRLYNLKMPFIIPKRGKGSSEVLASCNIVGYGQYNGVDYMSYLSPYARNICDKSLPVEIVRDIVDNTGLKKLDMNILFDYHLDRATPSYSPTFYELNCFYNTSFSWGKTSVGMGMNIPIRIQQGGFTGVGDFQIEISQSKYSFFEDMLDDIQKHLDIKIYPLNSSQDEEIAQKVIDTGRSLKEYVSDIKKIKAFGKMGNGGSIKIRMKDVYNMYNLESEIIW